MSARLHIRTLNATGRMTGNPERLPACERAARRVLSHDLPNTCGDELDRALPRDDPTVWRIRRLDLTLAPLLDGADEGRVAREWSRALAESILKAIAAMPAGDVVRFESSAHYFAQFCADRAAGFAAGAWFYREFAGFDAMPPGLAISTVLTREPEVIGPALLHLARMGTLEVVLAALAPASERRILAAVAAAACSSDIAAAIPVVLAVPRTDRTLRWLAVVLARNPSLSAAAAAAVISALTSSPTLARDFVEAHTAGLRLPEPPSPAEHETYVSAHACVFLLLPAYAAENCDDELPDVGREWFRAEVLAACMDCPAGDIAIRLAAAVDEAEPALEPAPNWPATRDALALRVLRRFAAGLIGFGDSTPRHLRDNFLSAAGSITLTIDRIAVALPAIPLQLVLRIAGWHGREVEIPWLSPYTVRISLEAE